MSTRGYELHRAIVYRIVDPLSIEVKIPALLGNQVITMSPEATAPDRLPAVGDVRMVAVSPERDHFLWIIAADSTAVWLKLAELEARIEELE